jgi:hypothetical protein
LGLELLEVTCSFSAFFRMNHHTAAGLVGSGYCFLEGLGAIHLPIADRSVIGDIEIPIREPRRANPALEYREPVHIGRPVQQAK